MEMAPKEGLRISGQIKINTYRAGFVEAVAPLLEQLKACRNGSAFALIEYVIAENEIKRLIDDVKAEYFIRTAVECPNLIMGSAGYGLDIIIQRLVGINTYSLNIMYGEIGTGTTPPSLGDTALTTPTNRAAVGFQQDYGSTEVIVQFFFSDSQLANQTYNEVGTFIDGTTTLGSGQLFNHALLSPGYEKTSGTDTTIQVSIAISNS